MLPSQIVPTPRPGTFLALIHPSILFEIYQLQTITAKKRDLQSTIRPTGVPLRGFHYKLVAAVVCLPT
jgi:hypothetical protein